MNCNKFYVKHVSFKNPILCLTLCNILASLRFKAFIKTFISDIATSDFTFGVELIDIYHRKRTCTRTQRLTFSQWRVFPINDTN